MSGIMPPSRAQRSPGWNAATSVSGVTAARAAPGITHPPPGLPHRAPCSPAWSWPTVSARRAMRRSPPTPSALPRRACTSCCSTTGISARATVSRGNSSRCAGNCRTTQRRSGTHGAARCRSGTRRGLGHFVCGRARTGHGSGSAGRGRSGVPMPDARRPRCRARDHALRGTLAVAAPDGAWPLGRAAFARRWRALRGNGRAAGQPRGDDQRRTPTTDIASWRHRASASRWPPASRCSSACTGLSRTRRACAVPCWCRSANTTALPRCRRRKDACGRWDSLRRSPALSHRPLRTVFRHAFRTQRRRPGRLPASAPRVARGARGHRR